MNKTVTIVLNGVLFHIEEEAYNKLKEYLDSIKNYYSGSNGDADEIVGDIEASIAEKFSAKIKITKQVISMADIDELIKVMGTIKDFAEAEEVEQPETSSAEPSEVQKKPLRRLYRNPDDEIIAGVASGIANYFGIDPVMIRLLFIVSVFLGGTGILLYIALWIIVPAAETNSQKLEMQGKPITLAKLEQVSREVKEKGKKGAQAAKKKLPGILAFFDSFFRGLGRILKGTGPVISIALGTVIVISMFFAILGVLFTAVVLLFNIDSPYIYFGYPFKDVVGATTYYLGVSAGMVIALIPLIFLLLTGILLMRRKNVFTVISTTVLLAVWMCAIVIAGALSVDAAPKVDQIVDDIEARNAMTQTYNASNFNEVVVDGYADVTITKGEDYSITATGFDLNLEHLDVQQDGSTLLVQQNDFDNALCIFCWTRRTALDITMPELKKIDGDYGTSFTLKGFEDDLLSIDGISQYFDSFQHRRDVLDDLEIRIERIENSKQRTLLMTQFDKIRFIRDGEDFLVEISPVWTEVKTVEDQEPADTTIPGATEDTASNPNSNTNTAPAAATNE